MTGARQKISRSLDGEREAHPEDVAAAPLDPLADTPRNWFHFLREIHLAAMSRPDCKPDMLIRHSREAQKILRLEMQWNKETVIPGIDLVWQALLDLPGVGPLLQRDPMRARLIENLRQAQQKARLNFEISQAEKK